MQSFSFTIEKLFENPSDSVAECWKAHSELVLRAGVNFPEFLEM